MKKTLALGLTALSLSALAVPEPKHDLCKNPFVRNVSRVLQNVEISTVTLIR